MSRQSKAVKKKAKQVSASPVNKKENLKQRPAAKKPMLNWLLLLVAILPFLYSRKVMDPVLTVRFTFMSGFIILFALYFYGFRKKLLTPAWPLLVKLVFLLGIAYGLWNMIALFTAVNKQQVYYGLGRHFLNMILLFIITQMAAREEAYLLQLCKLLAVAAIIHSFIGVCQFYDIAFSDLPGNYKPYGLMANRNLYGTAQILLLPFALFVLYKAGKIWKYVAALALIGIAVSSILSQTRSSWLAGLASLVVALVLVLVFSPANRKKWLIGTAAGLAAVAALTFLLISTDTEGVLSESLKERTGNIFVTDSTGVTSSAAGNVSERLKIWKKTTELIKDNLLTGVGPGNWRLVVAKYGSEGLAWSYGKYIPDSTHNEYLLVLSESGIPGTLLYFGMWLMIAVIAFKTIVKPLTEERRILNILMVSSLAGLAVDSMFSFPTDRIEHTMYIYLIAGIILGSFTNSGSDAAAKKLSPGSYRRYKWQLPLFLVIASFDFFLGLKKYNFENQLRLTKQLEEAGSFQEAIDEGNKGKNAFVSIPPNGLPIETYVSLAYKGLNKFTEALKEMNTAIHYHPYNKALYVNKGTIYTSMKQYDTAIKYYLQALKLTPDFDIIYFNIAVNYFYLQNYKACLETLSKVDIGSEKTLQDIKQQATDRLAAQR